MRTDEGIGRQCDRRRRAANTTKDCAVEAELPRLLRRDPVTQLNQVTPSHSTTQQRSCIDLTLAKNLCKVVTEPISVYHTDHKAIALPLPNEENKYMYPCLTLCGVLQLRWSSTFTEWSGSFI